MTNDRWQSRIKKCDEGAVVVEGSARYTKLVEARPTTSCLGCLERCRERLCSQSVSEVRSARTWMSGRGEGYGG